MKKSLNQISIVVPTLNEAGNVAMLIERIGQSFAGSSVTYEILFIDDHSSDTTIEEITKHASSYPVRVLTKNGTRGKAYSLLQGFAAARYETICMIDADLQYPPEAILPMFELMRSSGSDVVLTERIDRDTSRLRKLSSSVFNLVFTRLLFGFDYDSQSGMKMFRKAVVQKIKLNPTPWSFDLEFIVRSLEQNFKIMTYQIPFAERYAGEAKVRVVKVTVELAKASLLLRWNTSPNEVKRAYRSNIEFVEKALATIAIVGAVLVAGVVGSSTGQASALELPVPTQSVQSVQQLVSKATDALVAGRTDAVTNPGDVSQTVQAVANNLNTTVLPTAPMSLPITTVATPSSTPIIASTTPAAVSTNNQPTVAYASHSTDLIVNRPANGTIQASGADTTSDTTITYPIKDVAAYGYTSPSSRIQRDAAILFRSALVIIIATLLAFNYKRLIGLFKRKRDTTLVG